MKLEFAKYEATKYDKFIEKLGHEIYGIADFGLILTFTVRSLQRIVEFLKLHLP